MKSLRGFSHQSEDQDFSHQQENFFPRSGMSNAMMQERMRSQNQTASMSLASLQQELSSEGYEISTSIDTFIKSNVFKAMERLVNKEKWDPEFAASWLGQAIVETGNEDLSDLDVVEKGTGKGRGMFQYTGSRRRPYDRARAQALQQGRNPNDINWQIDYALNQDNPALNFDRLREGLTDPKTNYTFEPRWGTASGRTPTGERYDDRYADANSLMKAYGNDKIGGYSRALAGEYTRPGRHHLDRRKKMSRHIIKMYREAKRHLQKSQKAIV